MRWDLCLNLHSRGFALDANSKHVCYERCLGKGIAAIGETARLPATVDYPFSVFGQSNYNKRLARPAEPNQQNNAF